MYYRVLTCIIMAALFICFLDEKLQKPIKLKVEENLK